MYRQHNKLATVQIMGDIVHKHNVHNYNSRGLSNIHVKYYRTQIVANIFLISKANDPILIYVGCILPTPLVGGANTSYKR